MSSVVVLGFFANRDEARSAAVELNRRRFPRAALLLKHSNGSLETWDPFSRRRLVGASLSIVIWGGLLGLAAIVFAWRLPFLPPFPSPLPPRPGDPPGGLNGRFGRRPPLVPSR